MRFADMNPMITQSLQTGKHELTMTCPFCGFRFGIYVSLDGKPSEPATWGISFPDGDFYKATITPSINKHPTPKGVERKCHMSVANGEVTP